MQTARWRVRLLSTLAPALTPDQGSDPYVLFAAFRADPAAHPLHTPSGKIELFSHTIAAFNYADCPPHPAWLPPAEWLGAAAAQQHPLHLVTIQPPDRLHSQMDPGPLAQANKVAGREALRMHPDDAAARGLADGDVARLYNARGTCLAGVVTDAALVKGVVVMATGAWLDLAPRDTLAPGDTAAPPHTAAHCIERNGNPNVLSLDIGTSSLTQGPSALSVLVEVEKWRGEIGPGTAYAPPAFSPSPVD